MTWAETRTRMHRDHIARHAEEITLSDGSIVEGLFDPAPLSSNDRFPNESGTQGAIFQPPVPTLWLLQSDADDLNEKELLVIRGEYWAISRIDRTATDRTRLLVRRA